MTRKQPTLKQLAQKIVDLHADTDNDTADQRNMQFEIVALEMAKRILKSDVGKWQPIKTAQKDGTWIILLMRNGQVWKASWSVDWGNQQCWCTDKVSLAGCVVTHWMPLPEPPK